VGAGEVNAAAAAAVVSPPNPNVALDHYLVTDPTTGATTFDSGTWATAAANGSFATLQSDLFQSDLFQSDLFQSDLFQSDLFQSDLFQSDLYQSDLFQSDLFQSDLYIE
jgi:uncharacterized protein YjbI with pentapeptide repeats